MRIWLIQVEKVDGNFVLLIPTVVEKTTAYGLL